MSDAKIARINDGLYKELCRIQDEMWQKHHIHISMPEASRILMSRRYRKSDGFEFRF